MTRALVVLAAAGLVAGAAKADPGGFSPPGGAGAGYMPGPILEGDSGPGTPECPPNRYGLHPVLQKLFFWKKTKPKHGGDPVQLGVYAPAQQGTLVFPHHPYVRSPRDYFMYDPNTGR